MGYKIEYASTCASDTHATILRVSDAQPAVLQIGSNADEPGFASVGLFRAVPPRAEEDALVQATRALLAAPLGPTVPALPGEAVRKLTVAMNAAPEEVRYASESNVATPPFLAAESAALALAKVIRKYPQVVLSAEPSIQLAADGRWTVTLKLKNVGVDALRIPHPDAWQNGVVSIQLTARRNDVAVAELRNEHQRFIALGPSQIVGTVPVLKAGQTVPIAPRKDVSFQFTTTLALSPGRYDAWLSADLPLLDTRGAEIMRVEAVSAKVQLR